MKKIVYTLVFFAAMHFSSQAQSQDQTKPKEQVKQEKVNPDGTLAPAETKGAEHKTADQQKKETAPQGANSAITEKGVPSSKGTSSKGVKSNSAKSSEPTKTEKK